MLWVQLKNSNYYENKTPLRYDILFPRRVSIEEGNLEYFVGFSDANVHSSVPVPRNQWFFYVLVINGPTINDGVSVSVNGQGDVRLPATMSVPSTGSGITIRAESDLYIDELTFWNRRLSAVEIQVLYLVSQGAGQTEEGIKLDIF